MYLPLDWAHEEQKAKELEANIVISACDAMDVFCDKLEGLGIVIRDTQADNIINEMIQVAMKTIQGEDDGTEESPTPGRARS
jgi:hypothetical protein